MTAIWSSYSTKSKNVQTMSGNFKMPKGKSREVNDLNSDLQFKNKKFVHRVPTKWRGLSKPTIKVHMT